MRSRFAFAIPILMIACLVPQGCEPSTANGGRPGANGIAGADRGVWPFWPAKMRIHPLTRIVAEPPTGRKVIEARVEFVDVDGITCRACGEMSIRLYADDKQRDDAEPIGTWNQDLRDLNVNRRQYDDVTRTYLFRLEPDEAKLTEKPDLRVFFVSTTGQEFAAKIVVK